MELVYLWVENYKNIQKQGFNFSPRFKCDYNPDTKELTINENNNYINIFPDNINITAIVGENGSGKSSVLYHIPYSTQGNRKAFSVFISNNKLHFLQLGDTYIKDITVLNSKYPKHNHDLSYADFSLDYDLLSPDFINSYFTYAYGKNSLPQNILRPIFSIGNSTINLQTYKSIVAQAIIRYSNVKTIFTYHPQHISIYKRYRYISQQFQHIKSSKFKNTTLHEFLSKYINELNENDNDEYLLLLIWIKVYSKNKKALQIIEKLDENSLNFLDLKQEIFNFITDNQLNDLQIWVERFDDYIDLLTNENLFAKQFNIENIKNDIGDKFNYLFDENIANLFEIDFSDEKNREFKDLSYGERMLYSGLLLIYDKIQSFKQENIIIMLDEPDVTLHPQWQKSYINQLINMLSDIRDKKFQIIITSHSPFLISDLPKQNIIFLKDGKQVEGTEKKQTFGANIHTLLSDSFFMSGGLMGEFAKGKIDGVIDYLNGKESQIQSDDEAQKLISIIGEPIIKNQLQKMLDSQRLKKVDKIDKIEQDIANLQRQLRKLKNDSDV